MQWKIYKATQKDIELLVDIIQNSFRDVAVRFALTKENAPRHASNCEYDWIKKDMDKGMSYFLIKEEGRVCGCAALEMAENDMAYLERLAVLPQKRKQGLGRALVDYVLNQAKQAGTKNISIGIIAAQDELKRWYQKIGFVETSIKEFTHLPFLVAFMNYTFNTNTKTRKQKQKGD
jgi:N-acetylglutamate synthase-like GNAT family acetyltransferase